MWHSFKKDVSAVICLWMVILLILLSAFCHVLIPDKTVHANRKCLPIGNQPPGFEVTVLRYMENKPAVPVNFFRKIFYGVPASDAYIPISSSRFEGTDIVVNEFSASGDSSFVSRYNIADIVYPLNTKKEIVERNGGLFFETADGVSMEESIKDIQGFIEGQYLVKKKFYLGTDRFGRDVFSRFIAATRTTVFTAIFSSVIAVILGLMLGMLSSLAKGRIRVMVTWLLRSLYSIPALLLTGILLFVNGEGFWRLCLFTGGVLSLEVARTVYSRIMEHKEKKYAEASYSLGVPRRQILRNHILNGIGKPLMATAATIFCAAVLIESGLNFLRLGVTEDFPSWGGMIRENYGYIFLRGNEYLTLLPGFAILLVSFLFVVLANRFRTVANETGGWTLG